MTDLLGNIAGAAIMVGAVVFVWNAIDRAAERLEAQRRAKVRAKWIAKGWHDPAWNAKEPAQGGLFPGIDDADQ